MVQPVPALRAINNIVFDDIKFDFDTVKTGRIEDYVINSVSWACPSCGCLSSEAGECGAA